MLTLIRVNDALTGSAWLDFTTGVRRTSSVFSGRRNVQSVRKTGLGIILWENAVLQTRAIRKRDRGIAMSVLPTVLTRRSTARMNRIWIEDPTVLTDGFDVDIPASLLSGQDSQGYGPVDKDTSEGSRPPWPSHGAYKSGCLQGFPGCP